MRQHTAGRKAEYMPIERDEWTAITTIIVRTNVLLDRAGASHD